MAENTDTTSNSNSTHDTQATHRLPDTHTHERTKSGTAKLPSLDQLVAKMKPESVSTATATDTPPRPAPAGAAPGTGTGSRLRLPTARTRTSQAPSTETSPSATALPLPADVASSTASSLAPSPTVAVHPSLDSSETKDPHPAPVPTAGAEHAPQGTKPPRGYKNVPTLEAISSRLALLRERSHTRTHSAEDDLAGGSDASDASRSDVSASRSRSRDARPAEGERPYAMGVLADALSEAGDEAEGEAEEGEIVDAPAGDEDTEATPTQATRARAAGGRRKEDEHPLLHRWVWYYDSKAGPRSSVPGTADMHSQIQAPPTPARESLLSPTTPAVEPSPVAKDDYEANLHLIGEIDTVESFARYWNWCKPPSRLERGSNYHFFKKGIKPMWEDPANTNGGKWVLTMRNNGAFLDKCWTEILMSLIGELSLDPADEVTGCVVSLRSRIDRIQLWTRAKDDVERVNALGRRLARLLEVEKEQGCMLEFQFHTDDWPHPGKYISINTTVAHAHPFPHHTPSSSASSSTALGAPGLPALPGSAHAPTAAPAQALQNGGGVMGAFNWRGAGGAGAGAGGAGRNVRGNLFGERKERD